VPILRRFVRGTGKADGRLGYAFSMADADQNQPLDQQLEEIGTQLAWVRDYL
jgi:hypothetical protein